LETLVWDDGFPKLKDAGGVELLRTSRNCKNLTLINCYCWSVSDMIITDIRIKDINDCFVIFSIFNLFRVINHGTITTASTGRDTSLCVLLVPLT
jgi:hypothetical protein